MLIKYYGHEGNGNGQSQKLKCIDLAYITRLTKSNSSLMTEMISVYLKQTPALINAMKKSLQDKDWRSLYAAAHKMIPSFSVVGIGQEFENMARQIQEYASTQQQTAGIPDLVSNLETVCAQACKELEEELNTINNAIS